MPISLFLDPVLNDANVDIWVLTNLYDTLMSPTADGKDVQPGLATKWEVAPDGKSVALTLRSGVKFADGSALSAEDVKWSLDRARDPKAGAWSSSPRVHSQHRNQRRHGDAEVEEP